MSSSTRGQCSDLSVCCATPGHWAPRVWYDDSGRRRGGECGGATRRGPKAVKGSPKWGDIALRVVAALVLLYLFLPILLIVLFSFNDPKGNFNYSWRTSPLK